MNIKKTALYLVGGLYFLLFSAACVCNGPSTTQMPDSPKQAPAVEDPKQQVQAIEGEVMVDEGAVVEEGQTEIISSQEGTVVEEGPTEVVSGQEEIVVEEGTAPAPTEEIVPADGTPVPGN